MQDLIHPEDQISVSGQIPLTVEVPIPYVPGPVHPEDIPAQTPMDSDSEQLYVCKDNAKQRLV